MALSPFPKSTSTPGEGCIKVKVLPNGVSAIESISYQYPLKLISPTADAYQSSVLVFLLSYGGGLVGGDQVKLTIDVQAQARLSIVTQGHTKVFQSVDPSVTTRQCLNVKLHEGAALCLLPDPVQPFKESVYEQPQVFTLIGSASLCLLDWVTQGRLARGEDWDLAKWRGRNELWWASDNSTGNSKTRLLVRDTIILDGTSPHASQPQTLRESMQGQAVFGSLILRGPLTKSLGEFFLAEFSALPRLGARDFDEKPVSQAAGLDWRATRQKQEREQGVLWSAASVRGCVVVKFGAATVEAGRNWIGSMLLHEGSIEKEFGEQALMCLR